MKTILTLSLLLSVSLSAFAQDEDIERMPNPVIEHLQSQFEAAETNFTDSWIREGYFWNCTEYRVEPYKEVARSQYLLFREQAGLYRSTATASRVKTFMHGATTGLQGVGVISEQVHRCEISGTSYDKVGRVISLRETIRFISKEEMIIETSREDLQNQYENKLSCTLLDTEITREVESLSICTRGKKG